MAKYQTGNIKAKEVNLEDVDFAIDTALSWDGTFPKPGNGDYLVSIDKGNGPEDVLVSRRYTTARGHEEAAEIALDAFGERHGYREGSGDTIRVVSSKKIV